VRASASGASDAGASGTSDVSASDNGSDSDEPAMADMSLGSKSRKEPTSSKLGFYHGHWVHILTSAKVQFRHFIHTSTPFPERNSYSLDHVHGYLLEAVARYLKTNKHADIDKG
jgi:hypothetical protein